MTQLHATKANLGMGMLVMNAGETSMAPSFTSAIDIGTSAMKYKSAYFSGTVNAATIAVTGSITMNGQSVSTQNYVDTSLTAYGLVFSSMEVVLRGSLCTGVLAFANGVFLVSASMFHADQVQEYGTINSVMCAIQIWTSNIGFQRFSFQMPLVNETGPPTGYVRYASDGPGYTSYLNYQSGDIVTMTIYCTATCLGMSQTVVIGKTTTTIVPSLANIVRF
jgi:hypothetical protein